MSPTGSGQPTLGRYALVREIARSNDIVWEGRDPQMNRRVAVKELSLPANLAGQARRDRIERFFREARAAGAMSHPNIVTIYEVGEDRGRYFIAMEYLEGQTLRERIAVGGPISLAEAGGYAQALCGALQYAHERGIVHRDIKPDNIHLLPGGIVKLTDFGIARITSENQLTVAGQVFGTPSYMSPEQILGNAIDARSDQFGLAIVIYEMISGLKPFQGDSVPTITYRIIHEQAPHMLGAPPAIDAILQRAMAKDPNGRFGSVAEFGAALASAIAQAASGGFHAPAPSTAYPAAAPHFAPPPQQQTAMYGTQTQYGIAPGMGNAGNAGVGSPVQQPPALRTEPPPDYGIAQSQFQGGTSQKTILAIVVSVLLVGGVLVGGGIALSKATHNFTSENAGVHAQEMFGKATQLYQFGDYQDAATAFNEVRLLPSVTTDMRQKSTTYEAYCYRQLAHKAQTAGDWDTAYKWYQSALALAPGDSQTQSEMEAVQRQRTPSVGNANPAANSDTTPTPFPTPPGFATPPPNAPTTNDFEAARAQTEAKARPFLDAGKQADGQGNFLEAQQQYRKAMEAGPGSPSATEASDLLGKSLALHPDNGLIGGN